MNEVYYSVSCFIHYDSTAAAESAYMNLSIYYISHKNTLTSVKCHILRKILAVDTNFLVSHIKVINGRNNCSGVVWKQ